MLYCVSRPLRLCGPHGNAWRRRVGFWPAAVSWTSLHYTIWPVNISQLQFVRFYRATLCVSAVFGIFDFKNAVTLKTGLGSVKVIENVTIDRAHMTCYWRSVVTMALSRVVSEIFIVEIEISWPWNPGQRSLKVIASRGKMEKSPRITRLSKWMGVVQPECLTYHVGQ